MALSGRDLSGLIKWHDPARRERGRLDGRRQSQWHCPFVFGLIGAKELRYLLHGRLIEHRQLPSARPEAILWTIAG